MNLVACFSICLAVVAMQVYIGHHCW